MAIVCSLEYSSASDLQGLGVIEDMLDRTHGSVQPIRSSQVALLLMSQRLLNRGTWLNSGYPPDISDQTDAEKATETHTRGDAIAAKTRVMPLSVGPLGLARAKGVSDWGSQTS